MDIGSIEREALEELDRIGSLSAYEALYARLLGRKDGALTQILRRLGSLPPEEKKTLGRSANEIKQRLEARFAEKRVALEGAAVEAKLQSSHVDVTLPGKRFLFGHSHPVVSAVREITEIFREIGFDAIQGPEIETDDHNFTQLNIPEDHPARDAHDTFYLKARDDAGRPLLLRTHTSPVQVRLMKKVQPPVRIIAPGRVYRHEAVDATHAAIFHQIEGLAVDTGISFADLKGTLTYFANRFFGPDLQVRFRPSYFPFVEPGAEMDLQCFRCRGTKRAADGTNCGVCKASGWIEMLGAGMVHPQVLRNVGYDPAKVSGFAFGMGVDRIMMTRLQIPDVRMFLESDLRFLEQFG